MSKRGDVLIENSLRLIWGDNYQRFIVTRFPAHFFYSNFICMIPSPLYVMGFRCSAYIKPFTIILEIMDVSTHEENLSIQLSAYSPQFLATRNTSAYRELERLVDQINNDPRYDLNYEFIMNSINNQAGCRLCTSTTKEGSLTNLISSFYDEAKFVFGNMTYDFEDYL